MTDLFEAVDRMWRRTGAGWATDFQPASANIGWLHVEGRLVIRPYSEIDTMEGLEPPPELPLPSAEQLAAAKHFFRHESKIYDEVLRQLLRFCKARYQEDSTFFDGLEGVNSIEELQPQIGQFQISIEPEAVDGCAWLSMSGDCDWEPEHGTGVCVWKDIVLEVGTCDTLSHGPDNEFTMLPPLEDPKREATRVRVIDALQAAIRRRAEEAHEAFQSQLPEEVRLASAIIEGDEQQVQELVERGIRLHNYPSEYGSPLTPAVHAHNADAVRRMLELGARPQVNGKDGQTPLKAARQLADALRMSQRLRRQMLGGQLPAGAKDEAADEIDEAAKQLEQIITLLSGS